MNPLKKILLLLLLPLACHAQEHTLQITAVAPGVYVFTTYRNYDGKPFPANGLYAVTDSGIVMIDCPWDTTQTRPLMDSIWARHHTYVVLSIATHFHSDRTGSFDIFRKNAVATYSSAATRNLCRKHKEPQAMYVFTKDTSFTVGGMRFETFYPGAGHTEDNIVVWLPGVKLLYGGCFIKSTEAASLGNLEDANVKAWGGSVQRVMLRYPDADLVIPGHQGWKDKKSLKYTAALIHNYLQSKKP